MVLKPEHSKVSAYYNLDNGTGKIRGIICRGNEAARNDIWKMAGNLFMIWAPLCTISNTGGTDHQSFDGVGIPGFQVYTGCHWIWNKNAPYQHGYLWSSCSRRPETSGNYNCILCLQHIATHRTNSRKEIAQTKASRGKRLLKNCIHKKKASDGLKPIMTPFFIRVRFKLYFFFCLA